MGKSHSKLINYVFRNNVPLCYMQGASVYFCRQLNVSMWRVMMQEGEKKPFRFCEMSSDSRDGTGNKDVVTEDIISMLMRTNIILKKPDNFESINKKKICYYAHSEKSDYMYTNMTLITKRITDLQHSMRKQGFTTTQYDDDFCKALDNNFHKKEHSVLDNRNKRVFTQAEMRVYRAEEDTKGIVTPYYGEWHCISKFDIYALLKAGMANYYIYNHDELGKVLADSAKSGYHAYNRLSPAANLINYGSTNDLQAHANAKDVVSGGIFLRESFENRGNNRVINFSFTTTVGGTFCKNIPNHNNKNPHIESLLGHGQKFGCFLQSNHSEGHMRYPVSVIAYTDVFFDMCTGHIVIVYMDVKNRKNDIVLEGYVANEFPTSRHDVVLKNLSNYILNPAKHANYEGFTVDGAYLPQNNHFAGR